MFTILLGPPGSGKGTVARILTKMVGVTQISTGDILRSNIRDETELGIKAKSFMDKGNLVPDPLVISMVHAYLETHDFPNGFIFDGFPRTLDQADGLEHILHTLSIELSGVILIDLDYNQIVERIKNRRTCSNSGCQAIYNAKHNPPKSTDKCDLCGSSLITRDDETDQVILHRLEVYEKQTKPLIEYYKTKGILEAYVSDDSIAIAEEIRDKFYNQVTSIQGR